MLISEIYNNLLFELNTDQYSGSLAMDEFNNLLKKENDSFIRRKVEEQYNIALEGKLNSQTVFSSKLLRPLVKKDTITPSSGIIDITPSTGDLSNNYLYWISMYTSGLYNGQTREITLLTDAEFSIRKTSLLTPVINENPVAVIYGNIIQIYPTDISEIIFTFIKEPDIPFLDYYIDANYNKQFLSYGQEYVLQTDEVYRDGTDSGTVNSITIELEYHKDFHHDFFNQVLEKISVRNRDQYIGQFASTKQIQEDRR